MIVRHGTAAARSLPVAVGVVGVGASLGASLGVFDGVSFGTSLGTSVDGLVDGSSGVHGIGLAVYVTLTVVSRVSPVTVAASTLA